MIRLTDSAAEELSRVLASGGDGLRLEVHKGGCAGWQYEMKIDGARPDDTVIETSGGRVLVDGESLPFLRNAVLDFSHDLNDSGFKITNPNATRSCGCGTSFEPAEAESSTSSEPANG